MLIPEDFVYPICRQLQIMENHCPKHWDFWAAWFLGNTCPLKDFGRPTLHGDKTMHAALGEGSCAHLQVKHCTWVAYLIYFIIGIADSAVDPPMQSKVHKLQQLPLLVPNHVTSTVSLQTWASCLHCPVNITGFLWMNLGRFWLDLAMLPVVFAVACILAVHGELSPLERAVRSGDAKSVQKLLATAAGDLGYSYDAEDTGRMGHGKLVWLCQFGFMVDTSSIVCWGWKPMGGPSYKGALTRVDGSQPWVCLDDCLIFPWLRMASAAAPCMKPWSSATKKWLKRFWPGKVQTNWCRPQMNSVGQHFTGQPWKVPKTLLGDCWMPTLR